MAQEAMFVEEQGGLRPTGWAVGPWSPDTLQASAYGGLLVRALEHSAGASPGQGAGPPEPDATPAAPMPARLSFDLWRPVGRELITTTVEVLRDGRKARTVEASLIQAGRPVARCTAGVSRCAPAPGA